MKLNHTVTRAYKVNPNIRFEVFIHKVDGLSDDHKIEAQRDIHQRANDELMEEGFDSVNLSFYLTSIYDHSIFEAFSKVVQKLIPQLPTLENLLNIFVSVCLLFRLYNQKFIFNFLLLSFTAYRTRGSKKLFSSMSCPRFISRQIRHPWTCRAMNFVVT